MMGIMDRTLVTDVCLAYGGSFFSTVLGFLIALLEYPFYNY
jgi:hypothetical protein